MSDDNSLSKKDARLVVVFLCCQPQPKVDSSLVSASSDVSVRQWYINSNVDSTNQRVSV